MSERILVVGGAGYLGSELTINLVRKGHEVTVFDNLIHGPFSLARMQLILNGVPLEDTLHDSYPQARLEDFQFVQGDTRDRDKTIEVVKTGFHYVYHFGELVGISACQRDPEETREVNYHGSKNVVDAVLYSPHQPRLVYNSSSSVYQVSQSTDDLTEEVHLPPLERQDPYCQNKVLVEGYIEEKLQQSQDFQVIILRPATVGGLSPRTRIELLPNHIVYSLMTTGRFALARAQDQRAVIGIEDIAGFLTALAETDKWQNGVYNLGNLNNTKGWFVREICRLLGINQQEAVLEVANAGDLRNLTINSYKAQATLGFSPTGGLKDLVAPIALLLGKEISVFAQSPEDLLLVREEFSNTPPDEFKRLLSAR